MARGETPILEFHPAQPAILGGKFFLSKNFLKALYK
jgi:hypothetical protein